MGEHLRKQEIELCWGVNKYLKIACNQV